MAAPHPSLSNVRTTHPERYTYAGLTDPSVAQNAFMCSDCGSLVLDLVAHDGLHEALARLVEWQAEQEQVANARAAIDAGVVKITEPGVQGRPRPTRIKEQ